MVSVDRAGQLGQKVPLISTLVDRIACLLPHTRPEGAFNFYFGRSTNLEFHQGDGQKVPLISTLVDFCSNSNCSRGQKVPLISTLVDNVPDLRGRVGQKVPLISTLVDPAYIVLHKKGQKVPLISTLVDYGITISTEHWPEGAFNFYFGRYQYGHNRS